MMLTLRLLFNHHPRDWTGPVTDDGCARLTPAIRKRREREKECEVTRAMRLVEVAVREHVERGGRLAAIGPMEVKL